MASSLIKKKYQCKDCIYAYNPELGDPSQGIPPGTAFEDLPESWVCPICKAGKRRFKPFLS
ncbi:MULTISPECIES: rubredoxin [Prochlorococcus]|uniref:rubredoxin n=1 Tax=Prochlorococcus TaxID=1218 RepID=UPI0005337001|nr:MULTISPECIES: rubredoxin [Prochlorococcus]KGG14128.1 Rubredoxin [Prochlorococcus sp. MIT 0601]